MKIKKRIDLIAKENILSLTKKDIIKHSISPKDLKTIVNLVNDSPLKIKDKTLFNFFMKYFKVFENHVLAEKYYVLNTYFINHDEYRFPAYYTVSERCFVCNFVKPIQYLTVNDIVAHLLYVYVYRMQLKQPNLQRKILLPILGQFYSNIIVILFGRTEGLLYDYDNLGLLKLMIFKYLDANIFSSNPKKLDNYVHLLDANIVRNMSIGRGQFHQYEHLIDVSNFKNFIGSLNKAEILVNIDHTKFISTIYKRYGLLPLTVFDTPDRIIPFLLILNFQNILNNNFGVLVSDRVLEAVNKYAYYQYSKGGM